MIKVCSLSHIIASARFASLIVRAVFVCESFKIDHVRISVAATRRTL